MSIISAINSSTVGFGFQASTISCFISSAEKYVIVSSFCGFSSASSISSKFLSLDTNSFSLNNKNEPKTNNNTINVYNKDIGDVKGNDKGIKEKKKKKSLFCCVPFKGGD
jgi:hypothetical protein